MPEGLNALRKELSAIGRVFVVAPETEKSAVGHAITMRMPLKVKKNNVRERIYRIRS